MIIAQSARNDASLRDKATRADLLVCAQLLNAAPTEEHRTLLLDAFEEAFGIRNGSKPY